MKLSPLDLSTLSKFYPDTLPDLDESRLAEELQSLRASDECLVELRQYFRDGDASLRLLMGLREQCPHRSRSQKALDLVIHTLGTHLIAVDLVVQQRISACQASRHVAVEESKHMRRRLGSRRYR